MHALRSVCLGKWYPQGGLEGSWEGGFYATGVPMAEGQPGRNPGATGNA
jgi:hypothetical protein